MEQKEPQRSRIVESYDRPVAVAPPARDHWQQGMGGWTAPFVDPERLAIMLDGLKSLGDRLTSVRFNNHTGLVRSLRGDLFPERPADLPEERMEIAQEFVSTYGTALIGSDQTPFRFEEPPAAGSVVRLRQLGPQETPVYGAVCCLNFGAGGRLNLVTSSWFPLPPDLEVRARPEPEEWPKACNIARRWLEDYQPHLAPDVAEDGEESWCAPGDSQMDGWVLLPWIDDGQVQYRPVWVVEASFPEAGQAWKLLVDVEQDTVLGRPRPLTVQAPIAGRVFLQNAHVPDLETQVMLDAVGLLGAAPDFPLMGSFIEPSQPGDDARRAANVYYHLCQARNSFEDIAATAWGGSSDSPVPMPGTVQPLPVQMLSTRDSGRYLSGSSRHLRFGKPDAHGQVTTDPVVRDPVLDCEVIYHEYAHAVQDAVQPDLFGILPYRFKDALGEGFSFYFGCTLSERPVEGQPRPSGDDPAASLWGEYAYPAAEWLALRDLHREKAADQLPGFDYLQVYGLFPDYAGLAPDPVSDEYGCGMLWARTLWDLRRLMGREQADAVILRSLAMLGGVQSELETPAEALLQATADLADEIDDWPSHERAMRLLFRSRGISAATPIRDLVTVQVGGKTCLLAAGPLGCTLSRDGGHIWTQLGSDGPIPAVALTTATDGANGVTVWAAGEQWRPRNGGGMVRGGQVYRYDLVANASGQIDTGQPWTLLPDLPETVEILSLLALDGQQAALLAGTERGLYLLNGQWTRKAIPPSRQVFDMVLVPWAGGERRVLVGTHLSAHVVDRDTWTCDPAQELSSKGPVLALAAGHATGEMWAGTAGGGIWHWPAGGNAWQADGTADGVCYSLLRLPGGDGTELVAGTNDGVYRRVAQGGGWVAYNDLEQPDGEALAGSSVLALARMDGVLLAATAQRGVWRRVEGSSWEAAGLGLSAAAWAEAVAPAPAENWSVTLDGELAAGRTASHVLWVPVDYDQLSLQALEGDVSLGLFAVTPAIDGLQGAGLQTRTLTAGGQFGPVPAGFYLLAVKAASDTDYTVDASLVP